MRKIYTNEEAFKIVKEERLELLVNEFDKRLDKLNTLILDRENLYINFKLGDITKEKFERDIDVLNKNEDFLRAEMDRIKGILKVLKDLKKEL